MAGFDYDVLIVGSGFGGSVAALAPYFDQATRMLGVVRFAGIGVDHLRRLARSGDQHRAGLLGAGKRLCTCGGTACPLSGGLLTGTTIRCQCHGSEFDITTGAVVRGPAREPLHVYEVQTLDGSVRIRA